MNILSFLKQRNNTGELNRLDFQEEDDESPPAVDREPLLSEDDDL